MVLPGELRATEDGELQAENHYPSVFQGKLDIAALLEDQLQLLPEGLDPEADPTVLEQLFGTARPQSEAGFGAHLRPCRDPSKDHLLSALHAVESFYPVLFAAILDGLLLLSGLLLVGCMALSAAAVWALWSHIDKGLAIAAIALLLIHLPATSMLLAMQLGGHHCFTAWLMVPMYDLAYLVALPLLQRQRLTQRRRLARRFTRLPDLELWLWNYRACRQIVFSALLAVPMTALGIVGCVRGWAAAAPAEALGVVVAASVVSALQAAVGFGEVSLNARWAGQMSFLSYTLLALQLQGSKKLPYEWQSHLAEQRLVVKPDAPNFVELSRPQQCQLLRLALQRPHFAISNVVTHPRPPQKNAARPASAGQPPLAAPRRPGTADVAVKAEETRGGAAALKGAAAVVAAGCGSCNAGLAAAWRRLGAVLGPVCSPTAGSRASCCGCGSGRRGRRRGSGSDSDSESSTRPQAPPSACLLLQSKSAVKSVVGLLAGPLAAARSTLAVSEFSVNLVSFTDAAACKHCRTLLELVIRQGLRSLTLCDSKLQFDFFGVLTSYLPSRHCVLTKLVLKDVMSSGISTLCMLCEGLEHNSSVAHLDLSNNQLWGLRGAKELRLMLKGAGGLKVLLLPFCNITSVGAVEILRGAAECATLEQIDFSQNHIGDDVLDWSDVVELRNMAMREIDLSFNWIQDSLMGWTAALLETFPTLKRLHLNHNSDVASSRVASRAATPRMMTPRTLTPRTLTPSNLRIASYSQPPATFLTIPSGPPAPAIATTVVPAAAIPAASPSSMREPGPTLAVGPGSGIQTLQPTQSTTVLSPCGSERHEQLGSSPTSIPMPVPPLTGVGSWGISGMPSQQQPGSSQIPMTPPVRQATGTSAGPAAYNTAMTNITNNSSNCNFLDWQAHTHAPAADATGRSRGQHLIAHLELYVLQRPAAVAATAAAGGCSSRDMNCRSLGRDSSLAAIPSIPAVHSGYSAASPTLVSQGPLAQGASLCASPEAVGTSGGLSSGVGVGAGTTARPAGSLWAAVAGMERLDLRSVPLPSWWARNPALRPASVLIDESMVYDEPPPTTAPVTLAPGPVSGGPSGGGAAASTAVPYETPPGPSANLGHGFANPNQHGVALTSMRSHTGQMYKYNHNYRLDSFRKQLSLRNSSCTPTATVNANQILQSGLPCYPSPQAAGLSGCDAARSIRHAAVLSAPWGYGPNTHGSTGGACLAGSFGYGNEGDGAASAPLVSRANLLWSGQVVEHSSPRATGPQLEQPKLQQQLHPQGAPCMVRSRTIGTCPAVVEEAAGGGGGGGVPCSAPYGRDGGGGGGGGSSNKDPPTVATVATPTGAELCAPKGAASAVAEASSVQGRRSLEGGSAIGSAITRVAVGNAVCMQAAHLHQLLEDGAKDVATNGSGTATAAEFRSAGASQGLNLHSLAHPTRPSSRAFGLAAITATAAAATIAADSAASGGDGSVRSGKLKPPPMAMSMPVPVPGQGPRVPSVSFGTMVAGGVRRSVGAGGGENGGIEVDNVARTDGRCCGDAANADDQSPPASTGSHQSSFLMVEGMAPEMFDAGLAILREASSNMPPQTITVPTATVAVPAKHTLEQQSAGAGTCANPASQGTQMGTRTLLSCTTLSAEQTAALMQPQPSSKSTKVPAVHQNAPANSFSFAPCSRKSLVGETQHPTQDAVSTCLTVQLSPQGASLTLPLATDPTSESGSPSAPATAASSTALRQRPLEVTDAAAALADLWEVSDGAEDGASGITRCGVGSAVETYNGEDEDLEVSFRVEAIVMAAKRTRKMSSLKGSAGGMGDDGRLLSNLGGRVPGDAVGEMMSPPAGHSDDHGVGNITGVGPDPPGLVQFRSDLCNVLTMHPPGASTPSSHRGAEPRTMLGTALPLLAAAIPAEAAVGGGGGAADSTVTLTAGEGNGTDSNDADGCDSRLQPYSEAQGFANIHFAPGASSPVGPATASWTRDECSRPYKPQPHRHSYDIGQTASRVVSGPHDGGSLNPSNLLSTSTGGTTSHQNAGGATVGSVEGISVSRVFSRIRSASAVEPASSASPIVDLNTEPGLATTTTEVGNDIVGDDRSSGAAAAAAATMTPPVAHLQHASPVFNAAAAAAAISGCVVSTGGTSYGALRTPYGYGACGSGFIGVEASNAVTVVITVGCDGQLRIPLRCLELPLRAAMGRRSGTTVSFRVTGLSHEGMRQLRALMAVAKVPVPERTYAWLLPSQSMHQYTANGYTTTLGGCGPVSCTSQQLPGGGGNSQILHSASAALGSGSGLYSGLGLMYHSGGSPTGPMASRAMSRMDSGAVYGGMPSYYFDNRGLPIDLGYILPPPTDSAEPSECLSAITHPATTVVMLGLPSLARTGSTAANATAAAPPTDGYELSSPPPVSPPSVGNRTVPVSGLVAGYSPLPPPPRSARSSYELDPLLQQRLSPSRLSPRAPTTAGGIGTADVAARSNGGGEGFAKPNHPDGTTASQCRTLPPPMGMVAVAAPSSCRSSTEDVPMQLPVALTGEARLGGEAADANCPNKYHVHNFHHHHQAPVPRRNPGCGSGTLNLPHGIMLVNLAQQRPSTPPTPLLAGGTSGTSPTAGHTIMRSNNKDSGINAIRYGGDRGPYDDDDDDATIGGAADGLVEHPLYKATFECPSGEPPAPLVGGVRCGGAFSGCGGLAIALGSQSLGSSCVADLARDCATTPLAPLFPTSTSMALGTETAAGLCEHLGNDLVLGPFGSSIGVSSTS
ncbi:hypothetical protein Vretimale_12818 [Volvox reticuliferus]|nr:hypothetical protein Vretimale_12818 [Volvox reticuliferus]